MKKISLGEAIARCPHGLRGYVSMSEEERMAFINGARDIRSQEDMLDYVRRTFQSM